MNLNQQTTHYSDGTSATGTAPLPGQSPAQQDAMESAIQAAGANIAPRITPADIKASIASEWYINAAEGVVPDDFQPPVPAEHPLRLLTFCVLVLRNGFTVTGESACASPANFNADIGRHIARENAVAKIWPLMGYELRSKLAWREGPQTGDAAA